jgi:HK97 gp10 family phage protein
MPVRFRMDLKGLEDYIEALAAAGLDVDQAVAEALDAGADIVLADMRSNVPVGQGYPDAGYLLSDLEKRGPYRIGNYTVVWVGLGFRDREKSLHGIFVEYGTVKMAARPYIRPAFDNNRARIRAAQIEKLKGYLPQ